MPPRVTYWTGTWDPAREAISKEIEALRTAAPHLSPVVAFSPGHRSGVGPGRGVLRLSSRHWLLLRALAPCIERQGDVTHVFGGAGSWHLLRSLGRRPVLLTVAVPSTEFDGGVLARVQLFAVETEALAQALRQRGVPADRIELVYPGVDLRRFRVTPLPGIGTFRIVFASTPADPRELEPRGIPLLVEIARRLPDIEVHMLWRQWGPHDELRRSFEALHPPSNVKWISEPVDIVEAYGHAHAVACLFGEGFGKSCPNSVIEAMACGRPALVAETCGLTGAIERAGAGVVVGRTVDSGVAGLKELRLRVHELAGRARQMAEQYFDIERTVARYGELYDRLSAPAVG